MKYIIAILVIIFGSVAFAQDPIYGDWGKAAEKQSEPTFPQGFNPDGRIGGGILTLFAGFITQSTEAFGNSSSADGFQLASQLAFPMDNHSTLFIEVNYANISGESVKNNGWAFGAGIRLFGGMGGK